MLDYLIDSFYITGIYIAGCIVALFLVSNCLYYTNTTDRINTILSRASIYNPYLDDYESEESQSGDTLDVIEDEQPIEKIEKYLENTNNLIENFKSIENPTFEEILENTFAKTTLKERLEEIIKTNNPVLVDDIFYPTPCASTLELKIWKQLINSIMLVDDEYIN